MERWLGSSPVTPGTSFTLTTDGDNVYSLMARNFFGEVANFYLADSDFSTVKSKPWEPRSIDPNFVYMTRIKLRRSMDGEKDYSFESGSYNTNYSGSIFTETGMKPLKKIGSGILGPDHNTSQGIPIPQYPRKKSGYKENFTMYSRPSAFGPPMAGVAGPYGDQTRCITDAHTKPYRKATVYDSFTGHNPAYTPPYYDGEAWVDLIFKPKRTANSPNESPIYTLDQILAETSASYWRFDPGYASRNAKAVSSSAYQWATACIWDGTNTTHALYTGIPPAPYAGTVINKNSMQISASIDLFGVEEVKCSCATSCKWASAKNTITHKYSLSLGAQAKV